MKKGMIYIIAAAMAVIISGCAQKTDTEEVQPEITAISAAAGETASVSAKKETAEKKKEEDTDKAEKKETKKRKITPLSPSSSQAYFQNDDFSVTVELTALRSSLYYPDVVHDMGADPKLYVVTASAEVKNMSGESRTFDLSKLSVSDMVFFGGDTKKFEKIRSGRTASGEVRFLCSLEQAAAINGVLYDGELFDEGEELYPEEFKEITRQQSADDVREYFHRNFFLHSNDKGYHLLDSKPTLYEMHSIKGIAKDGKNYLLVSFTGYNRSDYAQLIEPSAFEMLCSKEIEPADSYAGSVPLEPVYISVDEKLVYSPKKAGLRLSGAGQLYEIPDFICMNYENPTKFTLVYDLGDFCTVVWLHFNGTHSDEPYYSDLDNIGYKSVNRYVWGEEDTQSANTPSEDEIMNFYFALEEDEEKTRRSMASKTGVTVPLAENQLDFSGNIFYFMIEFTGAESLAYYPRAVDLQQYRESYYVLHTKCTVTNCSGSSFDFVPQYINISGTKDGHAGSMSVMKVKDRGLVVPESRYTVGPGETVSFDADFVGEELCVDHADEISYCNHEEEDFSFIDVYSGGKTEEEINVTSIKMFEITDRNLVKKAVSSARGPETAAAPSELVPKEGEYSVLTHKNSICFTAEHFSKNYVKISMRIQCLTGEPEEFNPRGFKLYKAGEDTEVSYRWSFDTMLASGNMHEVRDDMPDAGETVYSDPYRLHVRADGTAEWTMYFFTTDFDDHGYYILAYDDDSHQDVFECITELE